jgi:methylglyoxal synthase
LQLSFAIKIQLHATYAIANLCNCLRQVAHDMQLHATIRMQHVYTVVVYMFIHTYQSSIVAPYVQLSVQLHATNENMTHV